MEYQNIIEDSKLSRGEKYKTLFFAGDNEDWVDAKVEDVYVDGIPLDGHYLEHLIESIEKK